jgi:hypothetical protein
MLLTKKYKKYEDMTREEFAEFMRDMNQAIAHLGTDIEIMQRDLDCLKSGIVQTGTNLDKALKGKK